MVKTNCSGCGMIIDTDIHPNTPEGHMCWSCDMDYKLKFKQWFQK